MSIHSISQAGQPIPERARPVAEQPSSDVVKDSVEISRGYGKADNGLIPPMMRRAGEKAEISTESGGAVKSPEQKEKKSVPVEINKWVVAEENTSYLIHTGGCGAIKIFVNEGNSDYSIVFHSFGTQDSKDAAGQIGGYILNRKEKPESVKILNIQPYGLSTDVNRTVSVISDMIREKGGVEVEGHTVCLNNIDGEPYTDFVCVDMEGTEEQILSRYDHLILKAKPMSDEDRSMKIKLFQGIPFNLRTPAFIRNWGSLSLEEARKVADEISAKKKPTGKLRSKLGSALANVRNHFTGSKD